MPSARSVKPKDHAVLALDIGRRFIKAAELRLSKGIISLVNVAVCPTPPGVLDSSQILDPTAVGRAIRDLLAANKIRTKKVIVAVSGQSSVVVRPIDLPKMSRKELADTMKFEVERHIPFTVDEVVMDYAPLVDADELPEEETNMRVLLAVAQEDLINAYLKVLSSAGLQPVAMDVEILAAIRALIDVHEGESVYGETVALINIGAGVTDISVVQQGNLAFTRSVPIAGDALTEAISEQLGRSLEEAEELKKEHGRIFLDTALDLSAARVPAAPAPSAVETPAPSAPLMEMFETIGGPEPSAPAAAPGPLPQRAFSLDEEFDTPGPLTLGEPGGPAAAPLPAAGGPTRPSAEEVDDDVPGPLRFSLDEDEDDSSVLGLPPETGQRPAPPVFDLDEGVDDELQKPLHLGAMAGGIPEESATEKPPQPLPAEPPASGIPADTVDDDTQTPLQLGAPDESAPILRLPEEPQEAAPRAVYDLDSADDDVTTPARLGDDLDQQPVSRSASIPVPAPSGPVFDLSSELEEQKPPPLARPTHLDEEEEEEETAPTAAAAPSQPAPQAGGPPVETPSLTATPLEATQGLAGVPPIERPESPQGEAFQRRIFESMLPTLVELVTEIRRSLEYFASREPDTPIHRIIVFGGTSRLPNLTEFIHQELGVDVQSADPLEPLNLKSFRQSVQYLQDLAPALPVCIGLGLRDMIA